MKKIILGLALMLFVATLRNNALACSCAAIELSEHIKNADMIFVGEIVSVKSSPNVSWDYLFPKRRYNLMDIDATFRVTRALQNAKVDSMMTVSTVAQSSMCGIESWRSSKPRERWLVFADLTEYGVGASTCSLTRQATTESVEAVAKAIEKSKLEEQIKKTKSGS